MQGVYVRVGDGEQTVVAGDGIRLAVKSEHSDGGVMRALLPATAMATLAGLLPDEDDEVELYLHENAAWFHLCSTGVDLVTQLIEGRFVDFHRVIPTSHTTRIVVDRGSLIKALAAAQIFAREVAHLVHLGVSARDIDDPRAAFCCGRA
jgi:DNA polymerase-3 subunit beta